jgi:hypothetical protein
MRPQGKGKTGLLFGVAAVGAAIASELNKPAEERTWHGKIAGVVPYDFRPPTVDRAKERAWNPDGAFLSPQIFGVGWIPNLGRIAAETGLIPRHHEDAARDESAS